MGSRREEEAARRRRFEEWKVHRDYYCRSCIQSGKAQFCPQTRACSDSRDARPTRPSHYPTAVESSRAVQMGTIVSNSERPDVANSSGACVLGHTERALSTIL